MDPVEFIENNFYFLPGISNKVVSGKKVKKHIVPFQRDILKACLIDDKDIFIGYTRQISKSTLFSWIVLAIMETKPGSRGFCLASKYEQTAHVYNAVKNQILFNPELKKRYEVTKHYIQGENHSWFKRASSKPGGELGNMAFSYGVIDELAVFSYQTKEAMENLLNGMAMSGHKPKLMFGCNPPSDPEHWSLDFIKRLQADKGTRCFIFSANKDLNIQKKETWAEGNPFIKHYLETKKKAYKETYNFYKRKAHLAKESKEAETDFRRQLLGQRVNSEGHKFIDISKIQIADDSVYEDKSLRWCLGIDPAWRFNFCAFILMGFAESTESTFIKPFLFLSNIESRRPSQKLQFMEWAKQDYIKIYGQDSIPRLETIRAVKNFIDQKNIKIEKVIVDPGQAKQWEFEKNLKGVEYVVNSPRNMTGSIRFLEKIAGDGKLFFIGKNPALSVQYDSAIVSIKSQDYCAINKVGEYTSVDGVVASTLAMKHLSENKRKSYQAFYC